MSESPQLRIFDDPVTTNPPEPPSATWLQLRWGRWVPALVGLLAVFVVGLLFSGFVGVLSKVFKPVFVPLLISVALAYIIKPLADWFENRGCRWIRNPGIRQQTAVLVAMVAAVGVLLLVLFIFVPSLVTQLTQAVAKIPAAYSKVSEMTKPALAKLQERYPAQYEQVAAGLKDHFKDTSSITDPLVQGVGATFSNLIGIMTSFLNLLLIPFFIYYILKDARALRKGTIDLVPPRYRKTSDRIVTLIDSALSNFVRGQLLVCLCMAILYTICFWILGVPSAGDTTTHHHDLVASLKGTRQRDARILLSHNPNIIKEASHAEIDLVLSGHTHGGQFRLPVVGAPIAFNRHGKKYTRGLAQMKQTQIYVNRGLGTIFLPIRYQCPPEISLLTLTAAVEAAEE